jgi:hypothetical protein
MPALKDVPVKMKFQKCWAMALPLLLAGPARAADVQVVPNVELRTEQNDNFRLNPEGSDSNTPRYVGDASLLYNIATPRGETLQHPRVRYQNFKDEDDIERVETFFDADSVYRWERATFDLNASYSKRDVYNTETLGGEFDPNDPDAPDNPESGTTTTGETRQLVQIRPNYEYRLTERMGLGFEAAYQVADYSSDDFVTKSDYDFGQLGTYLSWDLSQRGRMRAGVYASNFETDDGSEKADAVGGELGYGYRWSQTDGIEATVYYEQNDITDVDPLGVVTDESVSDVGGSLSAYRKLEVSAWRASISRRFQPTGDRGKSTIDQFRLQYDRDLSERLNFRGAARYESRSGLTDDVGGSNDRDYARLDLRLKWNISQTWYVGGGYAYIWQDRAADPTDADNNKIFVYVGYQGLSRRPTQLQDPRQERE